MYKVSAELLQEIANLLKSVSTTNILFQERQNKKKAEILLEKIKKEYLAIK